MQTSVPCNAEATRNGQPAVIKRVLTTDVDDQAQSLDGWHQRYRQLGSGRFSGELLSLKLPDIDVFFERTNRSLHEFGVPPTGRVALGLALGIDGEGWLAGHKFTRDSLLAIDAGSEYTFFTPNESLLGVVVLDCDNLMDAAAALQIEDIVEAKLASGTAQLDTSAARALRDSLSAVHDLTSSGAPVLQEASFQQLLSRSLQQDWLLALRASNPIDLRILCSTRQRRQIAMTSFEFICRHLAELPTVADICREVRVHERVLQYCTQEVFGVTPTALLRNMRLHEVRRELRMDIRCPRETIGDVAARWGFWHPSRFASEYRQLFGERPSETCGACGRHPS